jgi:heterodisulfide reductase subunit A
MAAVIDPSVCSGCKSCLSACQFGAIDYDAGRKQASINPLLCMACGMCAVACPGGAVSAMHFTDSAITAEIHGLLKKERGGSSLSGNVS